MKIATYNVNGVNGRLESLLRWLKADRPDIVGLQELKAMDEKFPAAQLESIGYGAVWHGEKGFNGVAILARDTTPVLTRVGLPGAVPDRQSRYIEAAVAGILVGCLYLPNGNPVASQKFAEKLDWYQRFNTHAQQLLALQVPAVLLGDFNTIPTDMDVYAPQRWRGDALFRPEVRKAMLICWPRAGSTHCVICTPMKPSTVSGNIGATASNAMPVRASTTSLSSRRSPKASNRLPSGAPRAAG